MGKSDWKEKQWRKRYATVDKQDLCLYKDKEQAGARRPCQLVRFAKSANLTVYSSEQADFAFSTDGYNYFLGIRHTEEGSTSPILLLFRLPTQAVHKAWVAYLSTFMETDQFNTIKKQFPTFDVIALEKYQEAASDDEVSSSDDDEMRDLVSAYVSEAADLPKGNITAPAVTNIEAAKKRLLEERKRAREGQPTAESPGSGVPGLKEKLAALKARNQGANIPQPLVDSSSERRRSVIEEDVASPTLSKTPSGPRSRLDEALARKRAEKNQSSADIAKQIQSFAHRLDRDVEADSDTEKDKESLTGSSTTATSLPPAALEKRARLLAKAKEARARKMVELGTQTEESHPTVVPESAAPAAALTEMEERFQDATARAQAAEAEIEGMTEKIDDEKEQHREARQRCVSLTAERDEAREKAFAAEATAASGLQKVKDRLAEVIEEKEAAKRAQSDAEQTCADMKAEQTANGDLHASITALEEQLRSATERLATSAESCTEADRRAMEAIQEKVATKEELDTQLTQVEALKESLASEAAKRESIEQERDAKQEEYDSMQNQVSVLGARLEERQVELAAATHAEEETQEDLQRHQAQLETVQGSLAETRAELAKLREGDSEVETLAAELQNRTDERDTLKNELSDANSKLQTALTQAEEAAAASSAAEEKSLSEAQKAQTDLAALRQEMNIISSTSEDIAQMRQSMDELLEAKTALESQLAEAVETSNTNTTALTEKQAEVDSLQTKLQEAELEHNNDTQNLSNEEEIALKEQINILENDVANTKDALNTAESQRDTALQEKAALSEELSELQEQQQQQQQQQPPTIPSEITELATPENITSVAEVAAKADPAQITNLAESINEHKAEVDRLTAANELLEQQLQEANGAIASLEDDLASRDDPPPEAKPTADLSAEVEALQAQLKEMQSEVEEVEKLREEVAEQLQQMEGLREELEEARKMAKGVEALASSSPPPGVSASVAPLLPDLQDRSNPQRLACSSFRSAILSARIPENKMLPEIEALRETESDDIAVIRRACVSAFHALQTESSDCSEILIFSYLCELLEGEEGGVEFLHGGWVKAFERHLAERGEGQARLQQNMQDMSDEITDLEDALVKERGRADAALQEAEAERDELVARLATDLTADTASARRLQDAIQEYLSSPQSSEITEDLRSRASSLSSTPLSDDPTILTSHITDLRAMCVELGIDDPNADASETWRTVAKKLLGEKKELQNLLSQVREASGVPEETKERLDACCGNSEPDVARIEGLQQTLAEVTEDPAFEQLSEAEQDIVRDAVTTNLATDDPEMLREQAESVEGAALAVRNSSIFSDGHLQESVHDALADEDTWKDVARRLLNDKKILQEELDALKEAGITETLPIALQQDVARISDRETAEKLKIELQNALDASGNETIDAEEKAALQEIANMEIVEDKVTEQIAQLQAAIASLNAIPGLKSRLAPENLEAIASAVDIAQKGDVEALRKELQAMTETIERLEKEAKEAKEAKEVEETRKAEEEEEKSGPEVALPSDADTVEEKLQTILAKNTLSEAQQADLQRLLDEPLSNDPEERSRQLEARKQFLTDLQNNETLPEDLKSELSSDGWQTASRLREENAALKEELLNAPETETPQSDAEATREALTRILAEHGAHLTPDQIERAEVLLNTPLSDDPEERKKQLSELQQIAEEIRESETLPDTVKAELGGEEGWRQVAKRLMKENGMLSDQLAASNTTDQEKTTTELRRQLAELRAALGDDASIASSSRLLSNTSLTLQAASMKGALLEVQENESAVEAMQPDLRLQIAGSTASISEDRTELATQHANLHSAISAVLASETVLEHLPPDLRQRLQALHDAATLDSDDPEVLQSQVDDLLQALISVQESATSALPEHLQQLIRDARGGRKEKPLRQTSSCEVEKEEETEEQKTALLLSALHDVLEEPHAGRLSKELLQRLADLSGEDITALLLQSDSHSVNDIVVPTVDSHGESEHSSPEVEAIEPTPSETNHTNQIDKEMEASIEHLKAELQKAQTAATLERLVPLTATLEWKHDVPESTRREVERLLAKGDPESLKAAADLATTLPQIEENEASLSERVESLARRRGGSLASVKVVEADSIQQALALLEASPEAEQFSPEIREKIKDLLSSDASKPEVQAALQDLAGTLLSGYDLSPEVSAGLSGTQDSSWRGLHKKSQNEKAVSEKVISKAREDDTTASRLREIHGLQQGLCSALCGAAGVALPSDLRVTLQHLIDSEAESVDHHKELRSAASSILSNTLVSLTPRERDCLEHPAQHGTLWKHIVRRLLTDKRVASGVKPVAQNVEAKQLQEALAAWLIHPASTGSEHRGAAEVLLMQGNAAPLSELRKLAALVKIADDYTKEPEEMEASMSHAESWQGVAADLLATTEEMQDTLARERASTEIETQQSLDAVAVSLRTLLASADLSNKQRAEINALLEDDESTAQQRLHDMSVVLQAVSLEAGGSPEGEVVGGGGGGGGGGDTWRAVSERLLEEKRGLEAEVTAVRSQLPQTLAPESDTGITEIGGILEEKNELEKKVEELTAALAETGQSDVLHWQGIANRLQDDKRRLEEQLSKATPQREELRLIIKKVLEGDAHLSDADRSALEAAQHGDSNTMQTALSNIESSPRDNRNASPLRCKARVGELEGSLHALLGAIGQLETELDKDNVYNTAVDIQEALAEAAKCSSLPVAMQRRLQELARMEISQDEAEAATQLATLKEMARRLSGHESLPEHLREQLRFLGSNTSGSELQAQVAGLRDALMSAAENNTTQGNVLYPNASEPRMVTALRGVLSDTSVVLPEHHAKEMRDALEGHPIVFSDKDSIAELEAALREKDRVISALELDLETVSTLSPKAQAHQQQQQQQQQQPLETTQQRAEALRDALANALKHGNEAVPAGIRTQLRTLLTKNLGAMSAEELHSCMGSLRAVGDALLGSSALPYEASEELRRACTTERPQQAPLIKPPHDAAPSTAPDSDISFVEKLGGRVGVLENAVRAVLGSSAAGSLTPALHYQLASLVNYSTEQRVDAVTTTDSAEEVAALKLRIAEMDAKASILEGHAERSRAVLARMKELARTPGMPEESKRLIHAAIASDAAMLAASTAVVQERPTVGSASGGAHVADLQTQVAEMTDALSSVLNCPVSSQLPDHLRRRIINLSGGGPSDTHPIADHLKNLQEAVTAVHDTATPDMFPEWLVRRLERLIQETNGERSDVLLKTLERLETKVQRLEGSGGRVDNLLGAVQSLHTDPASLPVEAQRKVNAILSADVAAAQRLLRETEASRAASLSASPGEAGAAALAALLRVISQRFNSEEGSAVQLAEASTTASGLCNATGVVGLAMNAVASLTHDALSSMRTAAGVPYALTMISSALKAAEGCASSAATARSVAAALAMGAHTGQLSTQDLAAFANRLYKEAKTLPPECTAQIMQLTKDLRQASAEDMCSAVLKKMSSDAAAIAGHSEGSARVIAVPAVMPELEMASELRRRGIDLRAAGAPPAGTAAIDLVVSMLETGDASVMWNAVQHTEDAPQLHPPPQHTPPTLQPKEEATTLSGVGSATTWSNPNPTPTPTPAERERERALPTSPGDAVAAKLSAGILATLRGRMVEGEVASVLQRGVVLADGALRGLVEVVQRCCDVSHGVPFEARQILSSAASDAEGTVSAAARIALRDPLLHDTTRHTLETALRNGANLDVLLDSALTTLSPNTARQVREILTAHRMPLPDGTSVLPSFVHISVPHAARCALSLTQHTTLSTAVSMAEDRPAILERCINEALQLQIPDHARIHLMQVLNPSGDLYEDSLSTFHPGSASDLAVPTLREGIMSVLSQTKDGELEDTVRSRLEASVGVRRVEGRAANPSGTGRTQVVVLEPPGEGEWIDCTVEAPLAKGGYRVRVASLGAHPAARFAGKQLAVSEEHMRVVFDALPKPRLGAKVQRNPGTWKWGDQDGGAGSIGTIIEVNEERHVAVSWGSTGRRSRYRWGHDNAYDVTVLDSDHPIEPGTRVCLSGGTKQGTVQTTEPGFISVRWDAGSTERFRWGSEGAHDVCILDGPPHTDDALATVLRNILNAGSGIGETTRQRLESLLTPKVVQHAASTDVTSLPSRASKQQQSTSAASAPSDGVLRQMTELVADNEYMPHIAPPMPSTQKEMGMSEASDWVAEAAGLLRDIACGVVVARGHQWVLLTPELTQKLKAIVARPPPTNELSPDPSLSQFFAHSDNSGVFGALKEVLDSRDSHLTQQIRGLLRRGSTDGVDRNVNTGGVLTLSETAGVQAVPETRSVGVVVDLTEPLLRKLDTERAKVKELQAELAVVSGGSGGGGGGVARGRSVSAGRSAVRAVSPAHSAESVTLPDHMKADPEVYHGLLFFGKKREKK